MDTLDAVDSPAARQRALFEFEAEWAKGNRPTAAEFAARYGVAGGRLLRELVVAEFRCRWKSGDTTPAEVFLRQHYPQFRNDPEVILFLIAAEVDLHPGTADQDGYVSRFPELSADIREWFRLRGEVAANWTAQPSVIGSNPDQTIDHRSDLAAATPSFREGDELVVADRFAITRPLGEGGFKVVFEAIQQNAGRVVAFKVPKSAGSVGPVLDEGRVVAQLEHQNIPPVMTVGGPESGGIVAERLIQGRDWREVLREQRKLRAGEAESAARLALWRAHLRSNLSVLLDVCKALRYAHERLATIHRDVKPQNVMLGGFGEVYLVDWGLAVHVGAEPNTTARAPHRSVAPAMCGTPAYMAPEMARGETHKLCPGTDVFLLGATLYEVLCGKAPYAAPNLVLVFNLAQTRTFLPPEAETTDPVPSELAAVVKKATAFDPARRYPDAGAFAAAVEAYLAHADVEDRLRATAAEHTKLKAGLAERRGGGGSLYPLITPLIEVADQYSEAARDLGTDDTVAEVRGRAVAGEREARLNLVDLAEASGDFALAEAQLDRIAQIPGTEPATVEVRRLGVRAQAARVRRTKARFRAAAATAAILAVGVGAALLWATDLRAGREIARANEQTAIAQADHEKAERGAALARAKAEEERKLGDAKLDEERKLADARILAERRIRATVLTGVADQARRMRFNQAATVSYAAAVDADDTPAGRRAWLNAVQQSLVPVATATGQYATGAIAYHPDGTKLVTGDLAQNGELRVWDIRTGELLRVFPGHPPPAEPRGLSTVRRIVFHPTDPDTLISAGLDGTVLVTNIVTGASVRSSKDSEPPGVQFLCVDISPRPGSDGKYRLVTGDTAKRTVIWDAATARPLKVLPLAGDRVSAVRFHPNGQLIAAGAGDRMIRFWDRDGNPAGEIALTPIPNRRAIPSDLAFSPDGKWLAVALDHPDIQIWDVATRKLAKTLKGHEAGTGGRDWVLRLAFSPNGALCSTGDDGTVRVWDLTSGKNVIRGRHTPGLEGVSLSIAVAVHPKGTELATSGSDYALRRWDAATGTLLAETRGQARRGFGITAVAWTSKTDRLLALSPHGPADARIWDANTLRPISQQTLKKPEWEGMDRVPVAAVFSPDEQTYYVAFFDGTVLEVNTDNGVVRHTYATGHQQHREIVAYVGEQLIGKVTGLAITPDGKQLLTLGADQKLKLWDTASRKLIREIDFTEKVMPSNKPSLVFQTRVYVEADGKHAVTLGTDGQIRRWELASGNLERTLAGHAGRVTVGGFSPDGRVFASGSDGQILVWDTKTWTPLLTIHLPGLGDQFRASEAAGPGRLTDGLIVSVAFSHDRRLLAVTQIDGSVTVIDVPAGTVLARGMGHTVTGLPDAVECHFTRGNRLITASGQGEVFEWNLAQLPGIVAVQSRESLYGLTHSSDFAEWASPGLSIGVARTLADPAGLPAITANDFTGGWYARQRAQWPRTEVYVPNGTRQTFPDRPRIAKFVPGTRKLVLGNELGSAVVLEPEAITARFTPPQRKPVWRRQQEAGKRVPPELKVISALAVDPTGELVAQGSQAGVVDLWRVADGSITHTFDLQDEVPVALAFRPTGPRQLAAVRTDGRLVVWDLASKKQVFLSEQPAREIGGAGAIAYSPDGKLIVHVGTGQAVVLYDADTGRVRQRLTGHQLVALGMGTKLARIGDVAFGRGGELLATCGSDGWVWVWKRDGDGRYQEYLTLSTDRIGSRLTQPDELAAGAIPGLPEDLADPAIPQDASPQPLGYLTFGKGGTTILTGGLSTPLYRIDLATAETWLTRPPQELVNETVRLTGLRREQNGLVPVQRNTLVPVKGK